MRASVHLSFLACFLIAARGFYSPPNASMLVATSPPTQTTQEAVQPTWVPKDRFDWPEWLIPNLLDLFISVSVFLLSGLWERLFSYRLPTTLLGGLVLVVIGCNHFIAYRLSEKSEPPTGPMKKNPILSKEQAQKIHDMCLPGCLLWITTCCLIWLFYTPKTAY